MAEEQQKREDENNEIKEMGTLNMKESGSKYGIQLLTIIGESKVMTVFQETRKQRNTNIFFRDLHR